MVQGAGTVAVICRGSELDNLLLVLLLVLAAHQTEFPQIGFYEVAFLLVVSDTWMSRARQRSMKTVRHGRIPLRSKSLVFWSLQSRFSIEGHTEDRCAEPAGQVGLLGYRQVPARSATCRGGADRHESSEGTRVCDRTRLRNYGSNVLQRRQIVKRKMGVGTGGIGLLWLYLPPASTTEAGCSSCVC